jgi:hypothetical protein
MKFTGNSWKLFGLKVAIFRNNFQLAVLMIASYFFISRMLISQEEFMEKNGQLVGYHENKYWPIWFGLLDGPRWATCCRPW